jgi:hypothetical protein
VEEVSTIQGVAELYLPDKQLQRMVKAGGFAVQRRRLTLTGSCGGEVRPGRKMQVTTKIWRREIMRAAAMEAELPVGTGSGFLAE